MNPFFCRKEQCIKCIALSLLLSPSTLFALPENGIGRSETVTTILQQQKQTITGTILTGDTNEPAIGATVYLRNSTTGTVTDVNGKYSITVEGIGGVLEFSYIGYKKQEVAVTGQKTIDIVLQPDTEVLEEVVVVGYGSQKKESVVGAISTLDVTKLTVPGSSISNALAGQLSGIVAMSRSGEPGKNSAADFYIRGVSSFKGTSTPLVLVDGIERDLDLVDTDDIASFSILKDASASAVYGVRGANGVILITTKKGSVGKPQVNVRTEFGFTQPTKRPQMLGSAEWAELYNEAYGSQYYSPEDIEKYRTNADPDLYPNVDWFDALFDDMAANQRVNLNITGGSDIVKYYVSGAFYNESSIYKNAGNIYGYNPSIRYNKFNFRANVDLNLTKSTVVNFNLANIYEKSFGPGYGDTDADIWSYTFMTSPNAFPVQYSDGKLSGPTSDSGNNPWNMLAHSGYREQFWNSAQSLIGVTQDIGELWKPLKGLTANIKFSWDAWNTTLQRRSKTESFYHARGRAEDGSLIYDRNDEGIWIPVHTGDENLSFLIGRSGTMTRYLEGSLTYNRVFNEIHRVGALLLYNQKIHTNTQAGSGDNALPYKNQGLAARATYAFKDTYFAEVNLGYNGSENFARGHRFGFFPAVAVGWMMSNEKWFQPATKVIDMLKLKASYGKVGNDDIGGQRRWVYESTIVNSGSWNYGSDGNQGGTGIRIGEIENLNASWEEALKINAGIEFSLFNKIRVQADYFREERSGIFLQRAGLPAIVGVSTIPYVNIGKTLNQGFDATVEYTHQVNKDLMLTARGNFTFNRNELLNNDEPDWEYKYQNKIGKPFGSGGSLQPFGLVAIGLFESQEEIDNSPVQNFGEYRVGDIKYQDINGDGQIDSQDQIAIGYTNLPEITYGFGGTAQYKNWDFNIFFQGVARTSFFLNGSSIRTPFSSGHPERAAINEDIYGNVWMSTNTPEQNANVTYPRLSRGSGGAGASNNSQTSTWWLRDGAFLRLKSVEIGYSLPKSLLQKSFIKSLRFYAAGNNLLQFSPFKLWDPEKGSTDGSGYPLNRMFSIGFNANF